MAPKIVAVGPERWTDLERLFGPNGIRGCWCAAWRLSSSERRRSDLASRRAALKSLVEAGEPVGLLAYIDGEAVGWCSVAPRDQHARLTRSRTLGTPADERVWSLTCLFIRRDFRRQGVAKALVGTAIEAAATHGAQLIEAFPDRNTVETPSCRGSVRLFRSFGFREQPSGSTFFIVMRRPCAGRHTGRTHHG